MRDDYAEPSFRVVAKSPMQLSDEHREYALIPSCSKLCSRGDAEEKPSLVGEKPVINTHAEAFGAVHPAYACGEVW